MPIFYSKYVETAIYLVAWNITENEQELKTIHKIDNFFLMELKNIAHPKKRVEYIASILALKDCCENLKIPFEGIKKDENGKPFLINSNFEISISHTDKFVAIAAQRHKKIGIDIEKPQEKMFAILPRLFDKNEIEIIGNDLEKMSIFWSAKEALYKLYGKRKVNFTENLKVYYSDNQLFGQISMPDYNETHKLIVKKIEDYYFVIAH